MEMSGNFALCAELSPYTTVHMFEHNVMSNLLKESIGEEVLRMSNDEIVSRTRLLDSEIKVCCCVVSVLMYCTVTFLCRCHRTTCKYWYDVRQVRVWQVNV